MEVVTEFLLLTQSQLSSQDQDPCIKDFQASYLGEKSHADA